MKIDVSQDKYLVKKKKKLFNRLQTFLEISNYLYIYIIGNRKRHSPDPNILKFQMHWLG